MSVLSFGLFCKYVKQVFVLFTNDICRQLIPYLKCFSMTFILLFPNLNSFSFISIMKRNITSIFIRKHSFSQMLNHFISIFHFCFRYLNSKLLISTSSLCCFRSSFENFWIFYGPYYKSRRVQYRFCLYSWGRGWCDRGGPWRVLMPNFITLTFA